MLENSLRRLRNAWSAPRSYLQAALAIAAWLTLVGNLALWARLARLVQEGSLPQRAGPTMLVILLAVAAITAALLVLVAWPRVFKPAAMLLLLVAATVQHMMLAYGAVIDQGMVRNALQTDFTEMRDQLSPGLVLQWLLVAGLPSLWLAQLRLLPASPWRRLATNATVTGVSLALAAGGVMSIYATLAPLVRNHMELRFMLNPAVPVLSTIAAVTRPLLRSGRAGALVPITAGAALGSTYAQDGLPPLLVMVVGETARADHFGLNGYGRDTTPRLAQHADAISFGDVRSCGTSTLASVPCMFSSLGKAGYESQKTDHENLLDVLQSAGLAVLWIDNQAGCKGVCDRVPHVSTAQAFPPADALRGALCADGDCLDRLMLAGLDERIAALPAERRRKGVVLVMHQMGSHGPAYYRRSAADTKRFGPECRTHELAQCAHDTVVNAFDNSIRETDRFLADTLDWLGRQQAYAPGLLYVSDHGESLGEYGVYLHGVPYAFAPDAQKQVPMVVWLGHALARRSGLDTACMRQHRGDPLTHDNLYPTLLGLLDVRTPTYRMALDTFTPCRGALPGETPEMAVGDPPGKSDTPVSPVGAVGRDGPPPAG
ncbi:sulfatase-like hydrolase/transferase [Xylophilus sp. Kf1]|nr:sulfatase-like hydrolase/transferase [Xylophilus sp. Kf1]